MDSGVAVDSEVAVDSGVVDSGVVDSEVVEVIVDLVGDHLEEQVPLEQYQDLVVVLILIEDVDHIVGIIDPGGITIDLGIIVGGIIHGGQDIIIDLGIIHRYMSVGELRS